MNSNRDRDLQAIKSVLIKVLPKKVNLDEVASNILTELQLNTPTPSHKKGIVVMTEEGSIGKVPPKKL